MKKNFKELNEKLAEMQKKFTEEGSKLFEEICKDFFNTYPILHSFSWTQYTPYFADGDECVFGVKSVSRINGYSDEDDEEAQVSATGEKLTNIFEKYSYNGKNIESEIVNELNELIDSAPDDILKAIYGDHCRITIFKDKAFVIEEYEHE
jgi:hypothetical protein